ncbi:hypothetical protein ACP70R_013443 [Stipagrostis hirtigluma subsp. patula]
MRIRRNLSRLLGSGLFAAQQPEAPAPEAVLPPPPPPLPPPPPAAAPAPEVAAGAVVVPAPAPVVTSCITCFPCARYTDDPRSQHPEAVDEDDDSCNNGLRDARAEPGLAHKRVNFVLVLPQQDVAEDQEEAGIVNRIGKQKPQKQVKKKVARKMKQSADQKKKMKQGGDQKKRMKAQKVMKKKGLFSDEDAGLEVWRSQRTDGKKWRCKKNDGREWRCSQPADGPNALCDYHLKRSRSYCNPVAVAPGATKSAPAKDPIIWSKAAPARAAPTSSKASSAKTLLSSSKQPRKKKKVDHEWEGHIYHYELFGPFRGKERGKSSSRNREEVTATANVEKEKCPQDNGIAEAEENGTVEAHEGDGSRLEAQGQDATQPEEDQDDDSGIAGGDEESDEDYAPPGGNSNRRPQNSRNNIPAASLSFTKMRRKIVKARSLRSLFS